jgi:hypothetical protein
VYVFGLCFEEQIFIRSRVSKRLLSKSYLARDLCSMVSSSFSFWYAVSAMLLTEREKDRRVGRKMLTRRVAGLILITV